MRASSILLIVAAIAAPLTARSGPSGGLVAKVEAVTVKIERSSASRRYVRFQSLEFALTIEPLCPANMRADSISISAADASRTLRNSDLDAQPTVETTLTIPRRQIVPLPVAGFCSVSESSRESRETLQIQGAFTASISLRCVNDERESIFYASHPLDLILSCESDEQDGDASTDQDASSTSTER